MNKVARSLPKVSQSMRSVGWGACYLLPPAKRHPTGDGQEASAPMTAVCSLKQPGAVAIVAELSQGCAGAVSDTLPLVGFPTERLPGQDDEYSPAGFSEHLRLPAAPSEKLGRKGERAYRPFHGWYIKPRSRRWLSVGAPDCRGVQLLLPAYAPGAATAALATSTLTAAAASFSSAGSAEALAL